MKTMRVAPLLILAVVMARSAAASEPDAALIAKITGLTPDVKNGIARVSVPRGVLEMIIDGVEMQPFQGLTSWAAFQAAGDQTMVMGDIVLTEPQVNPAMSAALDNGLQVTALHNHFFFDHPHVSSCTSVAWGPLSTVDRVRNTAWTRPTRHQKEPASGWAVRRIPTTSTIDPKPLETVLGASAQAKDGLGEVLLWPQNVHARHRGRRRRWA